MLKFFYFSFFLGTFTYAQDPNPNEPFYVIETIGGQYTSEDVKYAITNADMCGFFYSDSKRKMTFDDGTVVFLNSSSEDSTIDNSCVVSNNEDDIKEYWEISQSGHLIRRIKQVTKQ